MLDLYSEENLFRSQGYSLLAGVDEVGRGCLAGPVFAGAVMLPAEIRIPHLNDSKKLTPKIREQVSDIILREALAFCISIVSVEEIDRINILRASLKAMQLAIQGLRLLPELVLVDGHQAVDLPMPQKNLVGGDGRCASIAAASVIAKVARDRFMSEQEKIFPAFCFSRHKGYGTAQHLKELEENGPTLLHRRSFTPVRELVLAFNKFDKSVQNG